MNKLVTGVVVGADDDDLGDELTLTPTLDAAATGTVEFFDGADSLGTATISDGTASFDWVFTTAGVHSITAVYSGDDTYASATSAAREITVNKLVTDVAVTPTSESVETNVEVGFVVDIDTAATGSVEFFEGTVSRGAVPVDAGSAVLRTTFADAGTHSVTVIYSGGDTFAAATSAAVSVEVTDEAEPAAPAAPAKPADSKPLAGTGTADTRGLILPSSGLAVLGLLAAAGAVVMRRKQAL